MMMMHASLYYDCACQTTVRVVASSKDSNRMMGLIVFPSLEAACSSLPTVLLLLTLLTEQRQQAKQGTLMA